MKVFTLVDVSKVKTCSYFLNGLSMRKQACNFCGVWETCDHIDNAEPYMIDDNQKVDNPSNQ